MGRRKHDGIPTDLSKLYLQQHDDNPEESPIKTFTVNDESHPHCIVTHYISASLYCSHTSTLSFLEFTLVQRLSNWIDYFHEH